VTGAVLAVLAVVVAAVTLVPTHGPPDARPRGKEGPARLASTTRFHLKAADRRAIDAALDDWVPAGMARLDVARAWALSGPEMRSGSTLATWRKGDTPIPYFVPKERTFHHWQTIDVGAGYVIFNLLMHPKDARQGSSWVFSGQAVKEHGRWLVNRVYTIAIMKPPRNGKLNEVGPADFAPPPGQARPGRAKAVLRGFGILPAVAIFAIVLAIPVAVGVGALLRARRWRRHVRESDRTSLPPLPSGYLRSSDEHRTPVGNAERS
jgi:hypothetical protein